MTSTENKEERKMDQMQADKCRYDYILMTSIGAFFQWPIVYNVQKIVLHTYENDGVN